MPTLSRPSARSDRGRGRVRRLGVLHVDPDEDVLRPRVPHEPATSERQRSRSRWSPNPVSLIERLASRPSAPIAPSASWYARASASASSARVISSPRTSTVARMPWALSPRRPAVRRRASIRRCTTQRPGRRRSAAPRAAPGRRRVRGSLALREVAASRPQTRLPPQGLFSHEALAGGGDERDRLGEQHTHGVAQLERLLVDRPDGETCARRPASARPRSRGSAWRTARAGPP